MVSPLDTVAERVGLVPTSPVLVTALTHSSFAAEHDVESNERLEFLGDAVVDLAVADLIVTRFTDLDEGTGSLVRSRVVNEASLAEVARALGLGEAGRLTLRPIYDPQAFSLATVASFIEPERDCPDCGMPCERK